MQGTESNALQFPALQTCPDQNHQETSLSTLINNFIISSTSGLHGWHTITIRNFLFEISFPHGNSFL